MSITAADLVKTLPDDLSERELIADTVEGFAAFCTSRSAIDTAKALAAQDLTGSIERIELIREWVENAWTVLHLARLYRR